MPAKRAPRRPLGLQKRRRDGTCPLAARPGRRNLFDNHGEVYSRAPPTAIEAAVGQCREHESW